MITGHQKIRDEIPSTQKIITSFNQIDLIDFILFIFCLFQVLQCCIHGITKIPDIP